jgi:hypothetical protein
MSNTLIENASNVSASTLQEPPTHQVTELAGNATGSPWVWLAITAVLLAISGGIRAARDLQFNNLKQGSKASPFALEQIPEVLGSWQAVPGSDAQLPPEIARIAGSSDHVMRVYRNVGTGETVSMLILYGLADSLFAHTPDICYPAAGYKAVIEPADRQITVPDSSTPVGYRASYFVRTIAGVAEYKEVFCSFLHNGSWLPEMASRWKMFRYHPGMFKIQIERNTMALSSEGSPIESLLTEAVRYIDSRISSKQNPK